MPLCSLYFIIRVADTHYNNSHTTKLISNLKIRLTIVAITFGYNNDCSAHCSLTHSLTHQPFTEWSTYWRCALLLWLIRMLESTNSVTPVQNPRDSVKRRSYGTCYAATD